MPQQKCHLNWENFTRKSDISLIKLYLNYKFIKMQNFFSQIITQRIFRKWREMSSVFQMKL